MARIRHIAIASEDPVKATAFFKEAFRLRDVRSVGVDPVTGVPTPGSAVGLTDGELKPGVHRLELFVDTPWYMTQPCTVPLDFSMNDDEIYAQTREMCKNSAGYEPYTRWRARTAPPMTPFVLAAKMRDVDDSIDRGQASAQNTSPPQSEDMSW